MGQRLELVMTASPRERTLPSAFASPRLGFAWRSLHRGHHFRPGPLASNRRENVPAFNKAAQLRRVDIQAFIAHEFHNNIT
jgi:hypothetical protein